MKRRTCIQSCMAALGLGAVVPVAKAVEPVPQDIAPTEPEAPQRVPQRVAHRNIEHQTEWMALDERPSLPPGEYQLAIDWQNKRYKILGRKKNSAE